MRVVKPSEFHKYPGGTLYYYAPNNGGGAIDALDYYEEVDDTSADVLE